jgi:acyl-CoA reductase-like NAD-dependent aldehyde dehydrogenase
LFAAYGRLRAAWDRDGEVSVPTRQATLRALRGALVDHAEAFATALNADFGGRSRHETLLTEVALSVAAIDYTLPRIAGWAKPKRLALEWPHWTAKARLVKRGRGVAGIIGPSNYPLQLVLMPLIAALSAGCRGIVKPSEATPRAAQLLRAMLAETIDPAIISVICGGPELAAALTELPLDVLLFTGSHRIGLKVAAATARHLTPLLLELGGKSPVIIDPDADLKRSAIAILRGKLMNAGQTCVAPDYVLVPRQRLDELAAELRAAAAALYPDPMSGDYSAVLSEAAHRRLQRLESNQTTQGLFAQTLPAPFYDPKLVLSPAEDSDIMREEIFGPLLPLIGYASLDEAIATINRLPPALVLYWFGSANARLDQVMRKTTSGAVSINETVLHAGISALPLGGIGASGMGRYHGRFGFDAFTHERPVFAQPRINLTSLMKPPYGALAERILKSMLRT